jgi:hypothetical protein
MGISFQRRKRVAKGTTVNVSKSGLSVSKKNGPVSISSRGRGSVRLGKGLSFRFKL